MIHFGPWYSVVWGLLVFRRKEIAVGLSVGFFVFWLLHAYVSGPWPEFSSEPLGPPV